MSGLKDAAQNVIATVTGGKSEEGGSKKAGSGEFDQAGDFKGNVQTQSGAVGIEKNMQKKPHPVYQEDDNGLQAYKASGKLLGKKAIVTGGDSGIGRAVAIQYAMEGADVAILYLPEEEVDAQKTSKLATQWAGKAVITQPCDIRDEAQVQRVIQQLAQGWGGTIDILVNNASVMYNQESIEDITTEQFDRTVKTNTYGTFFMTKHALKYIPKGGNIIITTSQVTYAGAPTLLDYSMTKGSQVGLIRSLSQNLLEKGIRVNGVAPGPVWTPLQEAAMDQKTLESWHESPAPLGRVGQPSEIGPAFVFLASADGSFFTGQVLHANGGKVING